LSDTFKPIVGIPCRYNWNNNYYELRETYPEAIYAAGGIPVILPLIPEADYINSLMNHVDAICLSGAISDVDPLRYGHEPKQGLGPVVPKRDDLDTMLMDVTEERRLPVLAICFGIQSLNVYRGGTLIQDINSEIKGSLKHMQGDLFYRPSHSITITEGSLLAKLADNNKTFVNSHHHQAVDIVGKNLEPIAWAADGIIEAVVDPRPDRFVLGVQWHPEVGWQNDNLSLNIFNHFIEKARKRHFERQQETSEKESAVSAR
jgi:putative glutamine amidotransferase